MYMHQNLMGSTKRILPQMLFSSNSYIDYLASVITHKQKNPPPPKTYNNRGDKNQWDSLSCEAETVFY